MKITQTQIAIIHPNLDTKFRFVGLLHMIYLFIYFFFFGKMQFEAVWEVMSPKMLWLYTCLIDPSYLTFRHSKGWIKFQPMTYARVTCVFSLGGLACVQTALVQMVLKVHVWI